MAGILPELGSPWINNSTGMTIKVCHVAPMEDNSSIIVVGWSEFNGRDTRVGNTPLADFVLRYRQVKQEVVTKHSMKSSEDLLTRSMSVEHAIKAEQTGKSVEQVLEEGQIEDPLTPRSNKT